MTALARFAIAGLVRAPLRAFVRVLVLAASSALLGAPPGYTSHIQTVRFLRGSLKPGGIVLDQQLANTLKAQPGDTVSLVPRRGAKPLRFPVSGVAIVTAPDVLFQPLNPLSGPAPAQPPANVAVLPLDTFEHRVAPLLRSIGAATPSAAAIPGTPAGTP